MTTIKMSTAAISFSRSVFETLFHTLAFYANFSRIFYPCKLVPHFHVPQFPPVQTGAANSCHAFSGPAFLTVPYFHVSHFQSPLQILYTGRPCEVSVLVMSECSLSGRGQGHVSNFYIVDLQNFATASRRYTGDIHNSTVVGLFMTPETMGADSVASWLSAHCS